MFEPLPAAGLAGLLTALRPRVEPEGEPPPPLDLETIRAEGFDAGFAAGTAAADAGLAPLRTRLAEAATALDAACRIDADRLRPLFAALVAELAEAVLGAEIAASRTVLLPLVKAALGQVRTGERPVFRAHPDTLAALRHHLPDMPTAGDATLAPDEFSITAPHFVIETGLAARLRAITARLS